MNAQPTFFSRDDRRDRAARRRMQRRDRWARKRPDLRTDALRIHRADCRRRYGRARRDSPSAAPSETPSTSSSPPPSSTSGSTTAPTATPKTTASPARRVTGHHGDHDRSRLLRSRWRAGHRGTRARSPRRAQDRRRRNCGRGRAPRRSDVGRSRWPDDHHGRPCRHGPSRPDRSRTVSQPLTCPPNSTLAAVPPRCSTGSRRSSTR